MTPDEAARALAARGAIREAELVLRATLAREPSNGPARALLRSFEQGEVGSGAGAELTLQVVNRWIREGMLVEALALLVGHDFGGPASEWANLLGELLAPVPAHAEDALVAAHRHLMRGGASVALTTLQDRKAKGPLPAWAERRLALLRWMLLDNAQSLPEEKRVEGASGLAAALQEGLHARSLEAMRDAALAFQGEHPGDRDAPEVVRLLEVLVAERDAAEGWDATSTKTVPVFGRPAAAMQLRMVNLRGARSIYTKLVAQRPGESVLQELLDAVRGIMRVLDGLPVVDRSFAPPPIDTAASDPVAGLSEEIGLPSFADKTALGQLGALEDHSKIPDASSSAVGGFFDEPTKVGDAKAIFEDETRTHDASELAKASIPPPAAPAAPEDDLTKSVDLSEALVAASRLGAPDPTEPVTAQVDIAVLEAAAAKSRGAFDEVTKPAVSGELPLAAFDDEVTAVIDLPADQTVTDITLPPDVEKPPRPRIIEGDLPAASADRLPPATPTLRMGKSEPPKPPGVTTTTLRMGTEDLPAPEPEAAVHADDDSTTMIVRTIRPIVIGADTEEDLKEPG